ncbi:MAG TPA: hypothetical protein VN733_07455, partial [Solirubrobacterales bacterium]|nr:hypothetical protein [Solirubrobacterales bacterium]
MRPPTAKLVAALLAILLTLTSDAVAASGELTPLAGSSWQADQEFAFEWDPIAPANPTQAVFRILNSQGEQALLIRRPVALMLKDIEVPASPDAYALEAWLENGSGEAGPHSTATLRFDDTAPPPPGLDSPPDWIPAARSAEVGVATPSGTLPMSGIGGFAISVDPGSGSSPCAQPDRCLAGEVDLAGGAGGAVPLGTLPEGVHFVRAVAVSGAGVPSQVATTAIRVD